MPQNLGSVVFGETLALEDAKGRALLVPAGAAARMNALRVVLLGNAGTPVETKLPAALEGVARTASGNHILFFRVVFFRTGDRTRVRAKIAMGDAAVAQGYRQGIERVLTARPDLQPIHLFEGT